MKSFRKFLVENINDELIADLKLTDSKHLHLLNNRQFERSTKFFMTPSGIIYIPTKEILEELRSTVAEEKADDYIHALFEEEVIHTWHTGVVSFYTYSEQDDEVFNRAMKYYVESVGETYDPEAEYSPLEIFRETVRQFVQKDMFGRTTEQVRGMGDLPNKWEDLTESLQKQVTMTKRRTETAGKSFS